MSKEERRHQGRIVRKEIEIRATPEQVWDAWAQAEHIAQWFVDRCEGDMHAGDTVTWCFDAFDYRIPIEVYEAVRAERLAFGGNVPGRLPALQEVDVLQKGGGVTRLRVANSGFGEGAEFDEELRGVDSGWGMALAQLKLWLESRRTFDRTHVLAVRPEPHAARDVWPLFTTADGLGAWLGESAERARVDEPLRVGSRVELALPGLGKLTGRALAATGTEVLLEWPELSGCLGLKTFAMGPTRALALDFSAWGLAPDRVAAVRPALDAALERLAARVAAVRA